MGNEIKAKYSADISQLEISNDKLAAQNEKLIRQVAALTAKAGGFGKAHASSWNGIKNKVDEYTRAVKSASNFSEWKDATEKLRGAQEEFKAINLAVQEVISGQKEAVAVVTHMTNSYNDLEARLRDVREQMKQYAATSDDFRRLAAEEAKVKQGLESINNEAQRIQIAAKWDEGVRSVDQLSRRIANLRAQYKLMADADPAKAGLASKIERMQGAYDRMSVSAKTSTATLEKNAASARVAADSIRGLDQQIEYLTKRANSMSSASKGFEQLTGQIRRLTSARQKLQAAFKPLEMKPERTVSAVNLGSLEAKSMQRDYLEKMARGATGASFDAATAKIRELNAEIAKMETAFRKAEDTMVIDSIVINSVEGLTQRIAHLQDMMSKVDNAKTVGAAGGVSVGPSREYTEMANTLVRLKKELKGLKDLQNIPVETVVTARKSYDALREAIERTKKARDASAKDSPEFSALDTKLQKLEAGYKRLTASTNSNTAAMSANAKMSSDAAKQALYKHRSPDMIKKDIGTWEDEEKYYRRSGFDDFSMREADKAANNVRKYREELQRAQQAEAAFQKTASSGGGAFRKVASNSEEGLQKQIAFLEKKRSAIGPGAEFDKLSTGIAKLQVRLKGLQSDAGKAAAAMSKGATAAAGSFTRLDYELKKAKKDLEGMTLGTKEFVAQQMKVARIQEHWDKLDKTINKTEKSQKQSAGVLGTMQGQAKSFLATYVGIHQVMTEITAEWEKQRTFQLDAANRGANIQGELVRQAPNIGVDNLKGVKEWARANQVDLLAKQDEIISLVGAAISGGAPNVESAKKVTAAALKINVGDKQLAEEMLQGGMTVARLNNSENYEAAFGQLRSSSQVSQAVNESEFIGNVMGKMAALTRGRKNMDGMSTERALEYITAASRIQADRTGDTSSTNMQAIFQRMDEFVPELSKKLKDKTIATASQEDIAAFKQARSFDEKLDILRRSKGIGDQYIDKQRTGGPKELAFALIQNNQATSKIMQEASTAVLPFKDAGKVFQEATAKVRDAVPALVAQRKRQAGSEQAATGDRTVMLAQARATWDSIWNADAAGNAPANLSGWDRGKRAMLGIDMQAWSEQRRIGTLRDGGNEATDMAKGVRELIRQEMEAGGTNTEAIMSLKSQLKVLEDISNTLRSMDAKANGERFFGDQQRQMMPPMGWKPRVLAPAAAAAAAATSRSR